MTAKADASLAWASWSVINWQIVETQVKQLQMRIAKATREGKHRLVKSLQWLLTHSYYDKLLAVKRVTQNRGCKTPGVDGVVWRTQNQKMRAVSMLKRRGYRTQPLKRVYIPKKNGKLRPLGIPPMPCRAQQALHLLALEPVSESIADSQAYGFRPERSCADAIDQCFKILSRKDRAQWILEGDIKACFDNIDHNWLLQNIPMDKVMLKKWLKAGYIDKGQLYSTNEGTPQCGIISPTLLTITLAGLEKALKAATKQRDKVNLVTYADDFIITGNSRETLENVVKPLVENFIRERGLELSMEKTVVTHINNGFDFLGFNIRKYNGKLIIKPAKKNVLAFLENIRTIIKNNATAKTENLIILLNPKIIGWTNYYRHVVSKATFSKVDHEIFQAIWVWAKRRHPLKNKLWIRSKYFCSVDQNNWVFNAGMQLCQGRYKLLHLIRANTVEIKRHVRIKSEATPYDPKYVKYFENRKLLLSSRKKTTRGNELIAGSGHTGFIKA
ncbi:MAG: group II intron reverse transcriptase/maturase [Neisseriaceae bacterium]